MYTTFYLNSLCHSFPLWGKWTFPFDRFYFGHIYQKAPLVHRGFLILSLLALFLACGLVDVSLVYSASVKRCQMNVAVSFVLQVVWTILEGLWSSGGRRYFPPTVKGFNVEAQIEYQHFDTTVTSLKRLLKFYLQTRCSAERVQGQLCLVVSRNKQKLVEMLCVSQ